MPIKTMKSAVYFGSKTIYLDMVTAAKSLLMNSDVDRIYFLIEDDHFPYEIPETIQTINISKIVPQIYGESCPNMNTEWTYIGLIRTAFTKILPDEKILSIDCDTIVDKDISELWDINLDGFYFAAVKEPWLSRQNGYLYCNAGVMMINLKKLREDRKDDQMIEALKIRRFPLVCQDVLNEYCKGSILEIPSDYNASQFTSETLNRKIVHYAGYRLLWREEPLWKKYEAIPWFGSV